jgi:divalent metal cation (Fe/Co/Zn/Cd) transporter
VHWAARPPDEDHPYDHEKADYLSGGVEGSLILLAALIGCGSSSRRVAEKAMVSHPTGRGVSGPSRAGSVGAGR